MAPAIPFWFYRAVAGAAELGGGLRADSLKAHGEDPTLKGLRIMIRLARDNDHQTKLAAENKPFGKPGHSDGRSNFFIPAGVRHWWPFLIGTGQACAPPWNAHLLLWQGIMEAVLGKQPSKPRENWRAWPREQLATLMHKEGAGKEHRSRTFVASLIGPKESVLDVGCGAGAGYEALVAAKRASRYVGIDSSEPSIEVARELHPVGDFRVGNATALTSQFGEASFDIVMMRHVLEHLPDFEQAMSQAIAVS